MGSFAARGLFEEAHEVGGNAIEISVAVGRYDAKQALAGFLGEVGLLEDALGRVNVGEVEGGSRVAGIENGRQTHSALERPNHDSVHLVVGDVADLSEIYRIYDLVVAVILVSVEIFRLSTVTWANLVRTCNIAKGEGAACRVQRCAYRSSGRRESRLAVRP